MQQQISDLHSAARAYAEAGIPVFPCLPGKKEPATENGFYDATTDLEQIDLWWNTEDFNVAFCPDDAGLFVVDIDPGASLDLEKLPATYAVRTPRGGYHYYYEGSGKSSSNKLAPHVDTRGVGGYVLAPPSATADGVYRVETAIAYASIPTWVNDSLTTASTSLKSAVDKEDLPGNIERAKKALQHYVAIEDVAIEGHGGDDRTYRLCCEMLDLGLSTAKAQELIEDIWNPACVPPWSSEELETKLGNAERFRQNEVGAYGVRPGSETFKEFIKNAPIKPVKLSRFYFKDEDEIDAEPDPNWLIKDLISERSTVMMYGSSGSYKSFLALDICLGIATGVPTFGSETKPGLVFYGALEGKAHLKKARRAWRMKNRIKNKIENFFVGNAPMVGFDGEMEEFAEQIKKRCGDKNPALIVIDTLSKSMAGLNENDAADAGRFIRFCDGLVEMFQCTVMAVHHNGKEHGKGARGSSAFFAGFDTVIEVRAHKATRAVAVEVMKQKDAEERELWWTFEGQVTGPSLTFNEITMAQYKLLTKENKEISKGKVGKALRALKAVGEDAAVSTTVLATELISPKEDETDEERAASISRAARVLNADAKEDLAGYCIKRGKNYFWYMPIVAED